MSDTIYCGSGKKKSDTWFSITVNPDTLKDHVEEYNGKKFVRLNVNVKDAPDQYGKDVSVSIDTWKPEEKSEPIEINDQGDTTRIEDAPF